VSGVPPNGTLENPFLKLRYDMWPEQTRGWKQRWHGHRDQLGDRIVAERTTGLRSEALALDPTLLTGEDAISILQWAVQEVTDIAHPALRTPREVQRVNNGERPVVLVSDYMPGTRVSQWLDTRKGVPPATGTVLHIARQVGSALRTINEHAPGLHHGTVNLDRVLLTPDGRVILVEAGVGLCLAKQSHRRAEEWWEHYGIAVPFSPDVPAFGAATDAFQLGLLVLELLLGRRLQASEYPDGLALLLGTAQETDLIGDRAPLGAPLFEWLSLALGLEFDRGVPDVAMVTDALEQLSSDDGGYVAVPVGLDVAAQPLEPWPLSQEELEQAASRDAGVAAYRPSAASPREEPAAVGAEHAPPSDAWVHRDRLRVSLSTNRDPDSGKLLGTLAETNRHASPASAIGNTSSLPQPINPQAGSLRSAGSQLLGSSDDSDAMEELAAFEDISGPEQFVQAAPRQRDRSTETSRAASGGTHRQRTPAVPAAPPETRRSAALRWSVYALVLTVLAAGGTAGWRYWRERNIGQATGTLNVDSKPAGATILIDGLERGKAPLSLAVPPGTHDIVAKSAVGMGDATIDIAVGQKHDLVIPLELGTDPGYIDVSTDPPGAQVLLDPKPCEGEAADSTRRCAASQGRSPLSLNEVKPGEHVLLVEQGPVRMERRFTLGPGERLTIYVPLAGWLTVRSRVPLNVMDKGRVVGLSTTGRLLVPAGRRHLQFVNDEFGVNTIHDVVVMAGQSSDVTVPLSAGVLSVSADLTAAVWVDGESAGNTPTGNISVPIGEHEVLVTHPTWGEQRLTVVVGLGAPTRLSLKLAGAAPKASQRSSPKRSGISAAR
jgi:hypothetical protein